MEVVEPLRMDRAELERELQRAGARFRGKNFTCPFHGDQHPSASIYQDDAGVWRFRCHKPECGAGGDIFDLRARLAGRPVAEVLREASGRDAEPQEKPRRVFPTVDAIRESIEHLGRVEAVYCYTNPDTRQIEVVQVRYVPHGERGKRFLTHKAVEGGFALGAPPKPWPIYNRARLRRADTVVVVEGEKCVHALHGLGIVATTSLSGAANADKADWSPLAGKRVYIWPDNDVDGIRYAQAVVEQLDRLDPKPEIWLLDPSCLALGDGGDVADFIAGGAGAEEVWAVLKDGSEPAGIASELSSRVEAIASGRWQSIRFPDFPYLSAATKALFPGAITVLCAEPGGAKSLLLLQWFFAWHRQGVPVALLELEEDRGFHLLRLLAQLEGAWEVLDDEYCRTNPDWLRGCHTRHRAELDGFAGKLHAMPLGQCTYAATLEWIEAQCKSGARILGIDPVTAIYTGEARHIEDLGFVVKAAAILRKYESRLILVTHPRIGGGKGQRTQDDLAGGRAFSRHTQTVLWLHHHEPPKLLSCKTAMGLMSRRCNRSIFVAKARNGPGYAATIGINLTAEARFVEEGRAVREVQEENDGLGSDGTD